MAGALDNARKALKEATGEKESEYGSIFSVSGPVSFCWSSPLGFTRMVALAGCGRRLCACFFQ
jgi:hypothetical protein